MKKSTTKRTLLTSTLSLILCVSMLIGTTFAWFTDSVTSGQNQIVVGNLDVELEYSTDMVNWTAVDANTNVFKDGALWEPGYTEVVYLRVSNLGNLALKYKLGVNVANETLGKNKANEDIKLSDYIEYGVAKDVTTKYADRTAARTAIGTATKLNTAYNEEFHLVGKTETATDADMFALVVYMPESVGNEANHNGTDIPVINLGLTVLATQDTVENDSFNEEYDKDAKYPAVGSVTVTESNTAVELSAGNFNVAVPAEATQKDDVYKIIVSNENTKTDSATGETTVAFDLTLYKNDIKISGGDTIYEVEWNVGTGILISEVTHNGTAMTNANTGADQTYSYDSATGVLKIYTKSFSPFEVTYIDFADNFIDNSWNNIILACQNNSIPSSWNVGDKKTMTIGDSTYKIAIIGKNHDVYSDGSEKAPLTFQLCEAYGTAAMNATQTNATGWSGSKMRTTTMAEILSAMPSEIQNAIKAVDKETLKGDGSGLETTSDRLFLLSEIEVNGSTFYSNNYAEGSKYDYYSDGDNKMMGSSWWLRGPGINNGKNNGIGFTQINGSGYMANGSAEYECGVVFGFCF